MDALDLIRRAQAPVITRPGPETCLRSAEGRRARVAESGSRAALAAFQATLESDRERQAE